MQPKEYDRLVERLLKRFAPQIAKDVMDWQRMHPDEKDPVVIIAAGDAPRLTEIVSRLEMIDRWDNVMFSQVVPSLRSMPPVPTNSIDVIIVSSCCCSIIRSEFAFLPSSLNHGKSLPS